MAETYQGAPCRRGHDGLRYVRRRDCVECTRACKRRYEAMRRLDPAYRQQQAEANRVYRSNPVNLAKELAAQRRSYRKRRALLSPEASLWDVARKRSKARGIPFSITTQDIVIPTHCPVFGIPLTRCGSSLYPDTMTLDRVIPQLGYIPGNVEVISFRANRLKSNATWRELQLLSDYMRKSASL